MSFRFFHISDLHLPALNGVSPTALFNKRALGYLSWQLRRRHHYSAAPLIAFRDLLHREAPDHLVITGDLTNLGLPQEYAAVADFLHTLGPPERVSLVPGNHDAYAAHSLKGLAAWQPWLTSDRDGGGDGFPFVHRRGPISVVGVSTACVSPPFCAFGRLEAPQQTALAAALEGEQGRLRVVLLHHPPDGGGRRGLQNSAVVAALLRERRVECVLHGHWHKARHPALADNTTPDEPSPTPLIFGAPALGSTRPRPIADPSAEQPIADPRAGFWDFALGATADSWILTARLRRWQPPDWPTVFTQVHRLPRPLPSPSCAAHSPG